MAASSFMAPDPPPEEKEMIKEEILRRNARKFDY